MDQPSPELMGLVGGSGKMGAPSPVPQPGQTPNAPVSAPMSTPEPKQGEKQNALISVSLAMDLLEQTLPAIGSETPEGQTILGCLSQLSRKFGHSSNKTKELVPAELMQLMQNLPQMGGMSPEAKAMQGGGMPPGGAKPM